MARLAIVEDGRHVAHSLDGHVERPDRVEAIRAHLSAIPAFQSLPRLSAEAVDDGELLRVHDREHLRRVAALCARGGGLLDEDTYATPSSDSLARVAAGGAVRAVEKVLDGTYGATFAVLRPPGHHASASAAMGFCLYNNVAVAIEHARALHGLRRVAILDIDVHHGNGTEATYWNDPDVLYTSLHQYPLYPGTGAQADRGGPEANGLTINVPLPAGTSGEAWLAGMDEHILPAIRRFEPELVVVSCGFDAHRDDPLAQLLVETATYGAVAERLLELSRLPTQTPSVWVLEGGYDLAALASSSQAVLERLAIG